MHKRNNNTMLIENEDSDKDDLVDKDDSLVETSEILILVISWDEYLVDDLADKEEPDQVNERTSSIA